MKTRLSVFFLLLYVTAYGQTGGNHSFPFIDMSFNARSAGLGGDFISVYDDDITMGIANPSLLNADMNKHLSLSSALMAGGINYGMAGYGISLDRINSTLSTYVKYVSYGEFERTTVNGLSEGTFHPVEMIVGSGIGKDINKRLSIGGNLNFLYSQLETYSAFGASVDFAGTYRDVDNGFLVTVLAKNIGYQFKGYTPGVRALLPVELQLAGSYKLKHAPFRFTLLAHHLNKWDLTYTDPNEKPTIDPLTGEFIPVDRPGFFDKLARHFTYQLEILVTDNIHLRAGFDFHRRKEFALEQRPGIAGFSFGAGLHFNKIRIDYGFIAFSQAGYTNMLTLSTHLSKWRK